ncbi:single hybrid motif-containing protein [Infundibulicybe gibba]|nr:single hybrid motif-containing protein [Infundibulicybe gibba]
MASTSRLVKVSSVVRNAQWRTSSPAKRWLHQTYPRNAITNLEMPAMSPTMTEGGIAGWKKLEGESFTAGDVLLEIETDKATIDVEAQDDGIMGKILLQDGSKNIPVGKVIALLAEEGDDISNLQPPKEKTPKPTAVSSPAPSQEPAPKSSPSPQASSQSHSRPSHSRPLFPSVQRLLLEHNISTPGEITGTGVRGMLTKGDVLAYLGKASGPTGTFKERAAPIQGSKIPEVKPEPLDGPSIRRLIVSTMLKQSLSARNASISPIDFDSIIADYIPLVVDSHTPKPVPSPPTKSSTNYLDGLI